MGVMVLVVVPQPWIHPCAISHFFISPSGNTQALMTIFYNNEDKFLEWEKVLLVFSYFENASYFTKLYPLCIENDSLIFNSHAWKFKQKSSNRKWEFIKTIHQWNIQNIKCWELHLKPSNPTMFIKGNHMIKPQIKYFKRKW